jgi:hypothetical protein
VETLGFADAGAGVYAKMTLDVVGGQAVSGTGTLTDPAFWSGADTMDLVTLGTPLVHNLGGGDLSYRFGGGTDLIGDTAVPVDPNGLVFIVSNLSNAARDIGFNIWSNGGGSYTGFLAGNGGIYNTYSMTAVPEPATWAMMLLGIAGLGVTLRVRRNAVSAAA